MLSEKPRFTLWDNSFNYSAVLLQHKFYTTKILLNEKRFGKRKNGLK